MSGLETRLKRLETYHGDGIVLAVRYTEDLDGHNPPDLVRLCGSSEQMPIASFWRRYGERGRLITVEYVEGADVLA